MEREIEQRKKFNREGGSLRKKLNRDMTKFRESMKKSKVDSTGAERYLEFYLI